MSASKTNDSQTTLEPRTQRSIERAIEHLARDGSVAFPSETVWGLAACARSEPAVASLRLWKGRNDDQPISLLVRGEQDLAPNGFDVTELAHTLMNACWPGPLTLVLPCREPFAPGIRRDADGAVGVRCSAHPIAAALGQAAAEADLGLLTATSLNHTGAPPARTEEEARLLCGGPSPTAPVVVAAGSLGANGGPPSTVLDLTGDRPAVIRWGALGPAALYALANLELEDEEAAQAGTEFE